MATARQVAANQANSLRSTGPSTAQGRMHASMNALKHGRRSRKLKRMREESYAFDERLHKWMAIGDAQDDMDEYLVYRNVCLSFELDRADRARLERCTGLIENSDEAEFAEVEAMGKRLFFDPAGPTALYGNPPSYCRKKTRTSWSGQAVDENDPAALVRILESNEAGCCWLLDQWQALRGQLESTGFWQSHDRLKAVRLLGLQPVEANQDLRLGQVFVASHALNPTGKTEFDDLLSDMDESQRVRYRKAVRARWPDLFRDREKEEWKQMLLSLVDENIERLNAQLAVHEENADENAERTISRLSFDPSPEGEALRNYQIRCTNALFRGMANYRKHRSGTSGRSGEAGGVPRHPMPMERSDDGRREVQARNRSDHRADHSSGMGNGQDGRLEQTSLIDTNGIQVHTDELTDPGEISQNATNEANFDETMSVIEAQEPVHVTANSGELSGLDNTVDPPDLARKEDDGGARNSVVGESRIEEGGACGGDVKGAVQIRPV